MNKLHVKIDGIWKPVFCRKDGRVVTCEDAPSKALPTIAIWAQDDLKWFREKFANNEFCLMNPASDKAYCP